MEYNLLILFYDQRWRMIPVRSYIVALCLIQSIKYLVTEHTCGIFNKRQTTVHTVDTVLKQNNISVFWDTTPCRLVCRIVSIQGSVQATHTFKIMYSIYSHSVGFGTLKPESTNGFSRVILAFDPRLVTVRIFWTVIRSHHFRVKNARRRFLLLGIAKGST